MSLIARLNADPSVHGILVQLPLPSHISEQAVVGSVAVHKDVDGFHPFNVGLLTLRGRVPAAPPCTPSGVMEMLVRAGVPLRGKKAVVIGRSNIVGMPMAIMLIHADATVQVKRRMKAPPPARFIARAARLCACPLGAGRDLAHPQGGLNPNPKPTEQVMTSNTPKEQMEEAVRAADLVVASAGSPGLVRGDWVKEGATVIDVGINAVDDASKKAGYRLVGDVCFEEVQGRAGLITPVPGGVGPMTIAMLMRNTVNAARRQVEGKP